MQKKELLLAALAAGHGQVHTPVQIQKLIFLIEKNLSEQLGGTAFSFVPYDYGPFDSSLYDVLRAMEGDGLAVSETTTRGWKKYKLTVDGQASGEELLNSIPQQASDYIRKISSLVRELNFAELLSTVYKAYPEMKVNSVFKG